MKKLTQFIKESANELTRKDFENLAKYGSEQFNSKFEKLQEAAIQNHESDELDEPVDSTFWLTAANPWFSTHLDDSVAEFGCPNPINENEFIGVVIKFNGNKPVKLMYKHDVCDNVDINSFDKKVVDKIVDEAINMWKSYWNM